MVPPDREQLRAWVEADDLIQRADVIVVIGYSFGLADEHFNDLVRKSPGRTRVLIVNPDLEGSARVASGMLGVKFNTLARTARGDWELLKSQRLSCIKAFAADVTSEFIETALR